MKIVRFLDRSGDEFYGSLKNGIVNKIDGSVFDDYSLTNVTFLLEEIKILYPCKPVNLYCVGLNFADHVAELGLSIPEKPANFLKPVSGVVNPGEPIVIPTVSTRTDYEGEMALVIKDKIKNINESEALEHILGVTPLNDVTERDMSYTPTQVTYSKSFDTFTSFGPVIETDINPENVMIRTYLNGEKVQEACSADFIFSCAYIVAYFSKGRTLYPGDIISTGTPSHVMEIQEGDVVEVEIGGISERLINPVIDEVITK
jgi:2-keto-4-pentenoate hydratase/2-oxohepta-3-ene-1,7-dioic acid hydratase in catechol pathway